MADDAEGMDPWEIPPPTFKPFDMIVPSAEAEVYVSPEGAMKAIDYLFEVVEDEKARPELRVQAASAIVAHHASRRPS